MVDAYKIKKWNSPNSVGTPFIAQFGGMRIHPEDAAKLGCTEGDWVQLKTPRGSAKAPIEITDEVEPSYLSMPNGHGLDYTNTDGTINHSITFL
ncbi:MAG: molybdopterin dinucleotide binding domain-containing protein [Flavobacteriales bacterium]